ncbi:ABC transporter permease/substrate-binding protein [Sphingomonas morindae]|uniref:ABC transporter permease subunit n=1 Tax=Sphingomonas morindae TaxID=1541170 RepID=A0ABY4X9L9_9SPHN|nr:glycine betaine ABC transporter substrate-binding protein [Sphingomonas morindae]USI73385.1 ABC transporter permease subunit [Sphingomonas morindae]
MSEIAPLAAQHLLLSLAALGLALLIGVPLGLAAARRPRLAAAAIGAASLIQTIPGLALLALFYPLLLAIGHGVPALGFLPALLALSLYALLPLLRGVIGGLRGVDPAARLAADALGMTRWQRLRLVEAPLAAPVAMAGLRTAAVWTIGAATLATTVGAPSLGGPIFAGLQTEDWTLVLAGCLAAAALALAADGLLALVERGLARRARRPLVAGLIGIAAGLALALAPLLAPLVAARGAGRTVTIGAKNFSEQFILARLIGDWLGRAGYRVRYAEGLGSAVALRALRRGDIDAYVDYSGTIWADAMGRHSVAPAAVMLPAIAGWLRPAGLAGPLGFENAYALAMREESARRLGIATLADLAPRAPGLRLGSDLEFLSRPEWRAVAGGYGLRFGATRRYAPSFMYRALASGQVDVISAFSSDGRIAAQHLRVLADPAHRLPRYDALLLVAPARARDRRFLSALRPLLGAIPVDAMRAANYQVDRDRDKQSPAAAARWLAGRLETR